jgi:endonuclease/exonuclease/phosphatase family metal-dependent hydrolase
MTWAARFKPDIISMNEVERYTSWGNTDGPAQLAALMKQKAGGNWYYTFATANGNANGNGNLILSRFPFQSTDTRLLSNDRVVVNVTIQVNGRTVNVFSTHLDADSSGIRRQQIGELTSWASGIAQQRIICGDFNSSAGSGEYSDMTASYVDSWQQAVDDGTNNAYAGNANGNTRNGRIDYVFYSTGAASLSLTSSQVFDVRDKDGVMPSDHRPLMSTFKVK